MLLKEAKKITGHKTGLGRPSKMPGFSTSLSAFDCKTGAKLAKVSNSVCSKCYAFRNNYLYPNVKSAHKARLEALQHPRWVEGMTRLIGHYTDKEDPYFRIHDSGDLQSPQHLMMWIDVARNLPWVNFWMPSKEIKWVKEVYKTINIWPPNLTVRLSAPMMGQAPPKSLQFLPTSTVQSETGFECGAPTRGNQCGPCRACWSSKVSNVDYHAQ
jgi:hypothetical protein